MDFPGEDLGMGGQRATGKGKTSMSNPVKRSVPLELWSFCLAGPGMYPLARNWKGTESEAVEHACALAARYVRPVEYWITGRSEDVGCVYPEGSKREAEVAR